jgi:rhamnosyltransferase
VVLLSQDALPADDRWLSELLAPFEDERVAATYSRQVAKPDASPMEQFFLAMRFPPGEPVRRAKGDKTVLTLEDVFFSNVSSAVRRRVLLEHPFDETLIMSEDQQLSRDLLYAGYSVVYQPRSVVIHSHNYALPTVFRRYFDSVYSLRLIFPRHGLNTSASMGLSYLGREMRHMVRHHPLSLPYYVLYTIAKSSGTLAGHVAERLPRRLARRLSFHREHWN